MTSPPLVAIIILNWNDYEMTRACLLSLRSVDYSRAKIVVVDNGSRDGSVERLASGFAETHLLPLDKNHGFAGGCNHGIRWALDHLSPDYILLLNNDTVVEAGFLSAMIQRAESAETIGAVVPKILYHDHPEMIWYAGGSLDFFRGLGRHVGRKKMDGPEFNLAKPVSFATGCAVLIKSSVIRRVGLLDESLFSYAEDLDWSIRVGLHGYRIYYEPLARVWHKVAWRSRREGTSYMPVYLATRNVLKVQFRYARWYHYLIFIPWFGLRWIGYMSLKLLIAGDYKGVSGLFRGVADSLSQRNRYAD
jgi:hypothetical protein